MNGYVSCDERIRIANEQKNLKLKLFAKLINGNDDDKKKTMKVMCDAIKHIKPINMCCNYNSCNGSNFLSNDKNSNNINYTSNYNDSSNQNSIVGNSHGGINYGPTVF